MKLDGYIRVSKVGDRRGPSFISPELQQEAIEGYARYKGAEILDLHTDLDESGAGFNRPGLERAIERAEQGLTDGIVVSKLDRFARSLTGALETIKRLDQAGAAFISVAEGLDPTTPAGKMMMRLMLVMAEFELDRLRESWDHSRRRAVARGMHLSGPIPTGYRRGEGGRLELDPESAALVANCYRMRAEFRSWQEILAFVRENQLKNPFGGETWTGPSLMTLMRNRVYLGEARSGAHLNRAAHEPLIDRGTWEAAQLTRTLTVLNGANPSMLSGLIRCAGCRHAMGPGGGANSRAGMYRRYSCKGRAAGGCPHPGVVGGVEIDELVGRRFFELYGSSNLKRAARADSRRRAEGTLSAAESKLDLLQDELLPDSAELLSASAAVEGARARVIDLARSTYLPSPRRLRARWARLPVIERRRYLALLIDTVLIRADRGLGLEDRVLIAPFGTGPVELPGRGQKLRLAAIEWGEGGSEWWAGAAPSPFVEVEAKPTPQAAGLAVKGLSGGGRASGEVVFQVGRAATGD